MDEELPDLPEPAAWDEANEPVGCPDWRVVCLFLALLGAGLGIVIGWLFFG